MPLTPLFDPASAGRPMRVAAFLSGSGSNVVKIIERQVELEQERGRSPFEVVFLFSDTTDGSCRGEQIAHQYEKPYFARDIRRWHAKRGLDRTVATPEGWAARERFDQTARKLVAAFEIDVNVLAGYMSVITLPRCVNVHPADLSVKTADGRRRLVGDHAVKDAIAAGRTELRSSTLWTDKGVDTGPVLMISAALPVELPAPREELGTDPTRLRRVAGEHQERLKEIGDWVIFPKTIEYLAEGRYAGDESGVIHFDGRPTPDGLRLD
ncbi:MAG: formyl transferase [Proteobacteria bacterium]|nr:formyl transferase [Pseudomonadota bacterium]MBU1742250.1 formyl transferase [Pseudomonadota bacterium]